MAVQNWTPGAVSSPTPIFNAGANLNSMATGAAVMDIADIVNTIGDVYASLGLSISCVAAVSPAQLNIYLYRLNLDGTTYGDGQLVGGTQKPTITPSPSLYRGAIVGVVGATTIVGTLDFIPLTLGTFRFVVQSQVGAAINPTGNSAWYTTSNLKVV
jgi:hypothetical protein